MLKFMVLTKQEIEPPKTIDDPQGSDLNRAKHIPSGTRVELLNKIQQARESLMAMDPRTRGNMMHEMLELGQMASQLSGAERYRVESELWNEWASVPRQPVDNTVEGSDRG